jgi:dihydroneopterin triphosphate aldolase (PTPS-III) / 6-pyruvoyltetrahydropterin synthase
VQTGLTAYPSKKETSQNLCCDNTSHHITSDRHNTTGNTSITSNTVTTMPSTHFEVNVAKEDFKFNAAHFVAFPGFRERLHGHNYRVGVRLLGDRRIGADGYVIDFGCIKDVCKKVCKRLNEHFLCPIYSDVLQVVHENDQVKITCEDSSVFVFPEMDCAILPIVHATTEELAIYLWSEILKGLHAPYLRQRGIHTMEITVSEAPGQDATFRLEIPEVSEGFQLDVREFIQKGDIIPMPCKSDTLSALCQDCGKSRHEFSKQLEALAKAINEGGMPSNVTVDDLKTLIHQG